MRKCILFSGPIGCSKTPVAAYLSYHLNLPIFNNDAIRSEVIEELKGFNEKEYLKRRDKRLIELVRSGFPFILDASIDREFKRVKEALVNNHYQYFIISFDLSKKFLTKLYKLKNYPESLERLDETMSDHNNFIIEYKDEVGVKITDKNFPSRLRLSLAAVKKFLSSAAVSR
jgi:hypothetical protein